MDEARKQLIAARTREAIAERKRAGIYRRPRPLVDRTTVEIIVRLSRRGWSLRQIAWALDFQGCPTARRGPWRHSTVRQVLVREAAELVDRELGDAGMD